MIKYATGGTKIKSDNVFHTWRSVSEVTNAYVSVKKTSLRTTPKKPKALRGRP